MEATVFGLPSLHWGFWSKWFCLALGASPDGSVGHVVMLSLKVA